MMALDVPHKTRREKVLELMSDGLPRAPPEIAKQTKVTKLDSLLHQMWQKGDLLATRIVNAYMLEEKRGKLQWTPRRMRFYVKQKGPAPISLEVRYHRWRPMLRINEVITERLLFETFSPNALHHKNAVSAKVIAKLNCSGVALFSDKIATKIQVPKETVRKALCYLKGRGRVYSKGWFNPDYSKVTVFDRGYLWFARPEQYSNRLNKHDVLSDYRQSIHEMIKVNSETERRFTPKIEIFGGSEESRKEKLMKTLCSIYTDIVVKEVGGEIFYYIRDILTNDEIEKQIAYWQKMKESKSSFHSRQGRAGEDFLGFTMQKMWESHDLKVQNMDWLFHITRDGKKKFNCLVRKRTSKNLAEFDRVLFIDLAPFSQKVPRRIYLVFESRYKRDLSKEDWDTYLQKIGDTLDFGTPMTLKSESGGLVRVLAPKANIVPVMVVPSAGKSEKEQNFASYVVSQGGLVLFISEFEKYLRDNTGKPFTFKSLFTRWLRTESQKREFSEYLLDFFGTDLCKEAATESILSDA
jgi:hypothetical protein